MILLSVADGSRRELGLGRPRVKIKYTVIYRWYTNEVKCLYTRSFFIVTHIVDELKYANSYTDGRFGLCTEHTYMIGEVRIFL